MNTRAKVAIVGMMVLAGASIGPSVFAQNNYGLTAGETIMAWVYQYQSPGVGKLTVEYSGGNPVFVPLNGSWVQSNASWSKMDAVAPLLAAYRGGDASSITSIFPTGVGVKVSSDVAAAMTVQKFNPSEVRGQPLAPSASTLTSATKSWLDSTGWSGALATYEAGQTTTTKPSTQPSSPPQSPKPTHSTAPTTKPSYNTQPKVSTQPTKTTTPVTQHTTAPKSLPVATKTQPVSVAPSASVSPSSVPLPPKTPYLAHHHVSRSHAVVAAGSHGQHKDAHHTNPWPWVIAGIVVVGGAGGWLIRRRMG